MKPHPWPEGARSVVLLTVNFDAESFDLKDTSPERLFGRYSYGRYGVRAGLPRLLDLFARHGVPATFFVPGDDARRHPALVREIAASGHEIAARGLAMENFATLGDKEMEVLRTSQAILADVTGHAPQGFRAPGGELSPRTLGHLTDMGFLYDASFQDADYPYVYALQGGKTLVELPSVFALDDGPIYAARHTHARLRAIWEDEIRAAHAEGILIPITMHLRGDFGSTRAARIAVLDGLLALLKQLGSVRFMTCAQLATHALSLGLPTQPDPYLAHADTLAHAVYRGDLSVKPL